MILQGSNTDIPLKTRVKGLDKPPKLELDINTSINRLLLLHLLGRKLGRLNSVSLCVLLVLYVHRKKGVTIRDLCVKFDDLSNYMNMVKRIENYHRRGLVECIGTKKGGFKLWSVTPSVVQFIKDNDEYFI